MTESPKRKIDNPEHLPRVFLAGPEVFLPDAIQMGKRKKELSLKYGFEGVFSLDAEMDVSDLQPREAGLQKGRSNEKLIASCDALIANITPFRGPSADVGTVYEIGFARARGMIVYAYTMQESGEVSVILGFPEYIIIYLTSLCFLIFTLNIIKDVINDINKLKGQ